jgi:hypothetical protein
MKENGLLLNVKTNGDSPRWVVYPQPDGTMNFMGPFKKASAELIAQESHGIVMKEVPDLKDKLYVNLMIDD